MLSRRVWLRFSLGALLFLVFCLAGFFAGFRYGAEAGKSYWRDESQVVQRYDVADLLSSSDGESRQREFAALIARITTAVGDWVWRETGGMGYIEVTDDGEGLEVLCSWKEHRQVKQALSELRQQQQREGERFQLVDNNDAPEAKTPVAGSGTF